MLAGFGLSIYYWFIPERKEYDHSDTHVRYTDFHHVATVAQMIYLCRGIAIICTAAVCFKYLELMPRSSTWYLTGTAISRAARELQGALCLM